MPEDVPDPRSTMAQSFSNTYEVEMVAGLVEYLVKSNEYDFEDITVLTPYNGQLAAFTHRLSTTCALWLSEKDRDTLIAEGLLDPGDTPVKGKTEIGLGSMLKIATIDNFQGEESKVVILSTVRSNLDGRVGFLKTQNRINVACSRAQNGFYIIGNASLMSTVGMWNQVIIELTGKRKIGPSFQACCPRHPYQIHSIYSPDQWYQIPECQMPCAFKFPCGHVCSTKCHAPSLHARIACNKPCSKRHEGCGHQCTKLCGEPCGECAFELPPLPLPCGHTAIQTCAKPQKIEHVVCKMPTGSVQLPCGHMRVELCSAKGQVFKCSEECKNSPQCGHCRGVQCLALCQKKLPCGHSCDNACHLGDCPPCRSPCQRSCPHGRCSQQCSRACDPCVRPCNWSCPHMGSCTTMCCLPCDRVPCSEPCTQILPCGHLCSSLCGEHCPTKCIQCITGKIPPKTQIFLNCGHNFDLEFMDNHVGVGNVYQLDHTGRITNVHSLYARKYSKIAVYCPVCGRSCQSVRRYAIYDQLTVFEETTDRVYTKYNRKINMFLEQMYDAKTDLNISFDGFKKRLRPGPLTGRINEDLVRIRGNALTAIQTNIERFKCKPIHTTLDINYTDNA